MLHKTLQDFTTPLKIQAIADFGKPVEAMVYVTLYFTRGLAPFELAINSLHYISLLVEMIFCGMGAWFNVDDPTYYSGYLPVSIILESVKIQLKLCLCGVALSHEIVNCGVSTNF
jgi:hypothetical protein